MKLSEAQNRLKQPKNKVLIAKGLEYESKLRMYTEPLFKEDLSTEIAWKRYNTFLKKVLSEKKYKRLNDFMRFPLNAVDISETTLTEIYKVFDASNSYFNIETGIEEETLLTEAVQELNIVEFIKHHGKMVLKNKPNTFVVMDRNEKGDEYFLTIDNGRLHDFCMDADGQVNYIAFLHSITKNEEGEEVKLYSFYCDEYYRVFEKRKDDYVLVEGQEFLHNYGECPAKMFMSDEVTSKDIFNKRVPLTSVLSKLEEWQTFDLYKFYTDHYGPFPVIEKVKQNCSVEGCNSGILEKEETWIEDEMTRSRTIYSECPSCKDKSMVGPGTVITLPSKSDKDDQDGSGIFRMISPDVASLEYIQKKLVNLESYIEIKTVGLDSILDKQAVNEKQVQGSFETRESVLLKIKPNFDKLYKWMVSILGKSKYGPTKQIIVHADFGSEYYLTSEEDIQKRFGMAKTNGMPDVEIDTLYSQLVETKYRSNPEMSERMNLIKTLDPMPYDNLDTKEKKFNLGLVTEQEFFISSRILNFVERFELENTDLVSFGKSLPLRVKVEKIITEFKIYADEYIASKQVQRSSQPDGQVEGS